MLKGQEGAKRLNMRRIILGKTSVAPFGLVAAMC